jgi:protoheme ferro-lyase
LALKKKLDVQQETSPSSDKKYKNPKIKRVIQDLQSQQLNNKFEVATLVEFGKAIIKLSVQDFEVIKQEGGIEVLVQICTTDATKKLP